MSRPQPGPLLPLSVGLLVAGCDGGSLRGAWSGSCDFSDGTYGEAIFLDLDIERDLGRSLSGQATVTLPSQGVLTTTVEGERAAEHVRLWLVIPAAEGDLDLHFDGQRDADEIEGSCELWVPGGSAPVQGQGELER